MNFLAWILVVSMIVTTIPATQASVWAGTAYNEMDDSFEVFANRYYFEAVFGESVTMKVNAVKKDANTSIVSYQWYKEDEIIESATANTCTVTANGYDRNYHCVVTDSCGKEKIVRFTVVTRVGLEVTYDKAQYNVISGGSKTLAVTARTKVDGTVISYKWKMYDEINEDWIDIPEENKNAYTMSSITSNIKIRCTVVAKYTYKGEKLFSHTEQEDVDFEINVSHYGFNACGKANGYYAYVKVGEPVTYTVTADDGTIVAEYLDQITQEYKKIDSTRDSYTFTPKVSGITKFRTYIEEDEEESEDCFEQQIVVFDVAGDIIIGQTKIITPIQSEGKDVGYEFMTTQAGEYSIYTKYEMPLTIACEDGSVFCDNTYYDESTDSLYKVTLHLKANTKYYIIVSLSLRGFVIHLFPILLSEDNIVKPVKFSSVVNLEVSNASFLNPAGKTFIFALLIKFAISFYPHYSKISLQYICILEDVSILIVGPIFVRSNIANTLSLLASPPSSFKIVTSLPSTPEL